MCTRTMFWRGDVCQDNDLEGRCVLGQCFGGAMCARTMFWRGDVCQDNVLERRCVPGQCFGGAMYTPTMSGGVIYDKNIFVGSHLSQNNTLGNKR